MKDMKIAAKICFSQGLIAWPFMPQRAIIAARCSVKFDEKEAIVCDKN